MDEAIDRLAVLIPGDTADEAHDVRARRGRGGAVRVEWAEEGSPLDPSGVVDVRDVADDQEPVKDADGKAVGDQAGQVGLRTGALKEAEDEVHKSLDAFAIKYAKQLDAAVQEVWDVHVKEIAGRYGKSGLSYNEFVERADDRAIRNGFEAAKKAFGADIAQSYVNHVAGPDDPDFDDDGLREAYVRAAALATVKEVREKVDADAHELTKDWFDEYRVPIKGLPDVRQQDYEDIRALATEPQIGQLRPPRTRIEGFTVEVDDGQLAAAPLAPLHLMSDDEGQFPLTGLNEWERKVVLTEIKRPDACGWYRNPSRAAFDSLGIAYRDLVGNWHSMHPDFLFFNEINGNVVASIVDPHGHHLDDAGIKLKILAEFAKDFGDCFHRIEAISEIPSGMRVLDMKVPSVREAVIAGTKTAVEYYNSDLAVDYDLTT